MAETKELVRDLVIANRILAHEEVVDGYGHVSARHPERPHNFLLSRSRSPELVVAEDILEFRLDGEPVAPTTMSLYTERYIHAAVYAHRPEVRAVVHHHAYDLIPFSVTEVPLQPLFHAAARIGNHVPVWDIAATFGEDTNMLVTDLDKGQDLVKKLGLARMVLMRGHGTTVVAATLVEAVLISIYSQINARMQMQAMALGNVKFLNPGEAANIGNPERRPGSGRDR
jgi:HCOMODA/2-hydroxy-3-carboxy-muconic semialdehyde decarboxylase